MNEGMQERLIGHAAEACMLKLLWLAEGVLQS